MTTQMTFPAGMYYVGDLCYVMHDEWDEVCGLTISGHACVQGTFTLADGRPFACLNTKYGDGTYQDQYGREYGVDAGLIGCIKVSDVDATNPDNNLELGQIVNFADEFTVRNDDGVLRFGPIRIDTTAAYDDEEFDE